ncbi:glycosyltransferase family 4 protein [Pseudomonas sp. HN11]|uniref:MraY family glycosyltransferase n=1 Tax=Pseudomonas sp. HN11 TaxID=1344094 RepID=UPI001F265520|nr:glycosyltransferase family 4 protein [Pseudomonas sp. HN11]UII73117.1 glycosyltransferase family 4 protein [Pseudomonas sp. HN11]
MMFWCLTLVVAVISFMFTGIMRRYAVSRSLIDVPGARSSHIIPTPRAGGVAIVLAFLLALSGLAYAQLIPTADLLGIGGAGILVAIVGFFDDHHPVSVRCRLAGHFSAAAWALFWLGGLPPLHIFGIPVGSEWVGYVVGAVYLVWMLNLYNFMDGIDGIASVEAICACLGAILLYWVAGFEQLIWLPLVLSMAVSGFLFWNFPPARIFMGDAGSGFLGMTLGALSVQAGWASSNLLWAWLVLLGVFVVDATFTLIRRVSLGEKFYVAHRTHGYQYASRHFGKHLPVTLAVVAINVFWLLPIALSIVLFQLDGFSCVALAYAPLVLLAIKLGAGKPEREIKATQEDF